MLAVFDRGPGRPRKHETLAEDLGAYLRARLPVVDDGTHWPSAFYQQDPKSFCLDVLGVEPWWRQVEVLESVRDHDRTAVCSGNKCGKSALAAMAALWFFSSYPDARVWITASTARQVTQIIWREIRKMHRRARIKLDGEPAQHAGSGLVALDLRQIIGFSAMKKEDAAGTSGARMLYIVDEASGVDDEVAEAIEGNRAGGNVHVLAISNGTRADGWFYEACREGETTKEFWNTIRISGEETPNYIEGRIVIPGLSTRAWCEEMERMHGRESPFYKIRVLGLHVEGEEGKIFSIDAITKAEERWKDTEAEGPLVIGLDPAGSGVGGDETVFAPRRGLKIPLLLGYRGVTPQAILVHLNGLIDELATDPREIVTVVLDQEGSVGAEVHGVLRAAAQLPKARFRVVGVRSSDRARRQPLVYERVRDELWAAFEAWIKRDGGAIPEHGKLAKDMHAPSWGSSTRNRQIVTAKEELRRLLGRSPDYGDAACLSTWLQGDEQVPADPRPMRGPEPRIPVLDPRAGLKAFDPYRR